MTAIKAAEQRLTSPVVAAVVTCVRSCRLATGLLTKMTGLRAQAAFCSHCRQNLPTTTTTTLLSLRTVQGASSLATVPARRPLQHAMMGINQQEQVRVAMMMFWLTKQEHKKRNGLVSLGWCKEEEEEERGPQMIELLAR